jgi:PKD repeat protein
MKKSVIIFLGLGVLTLAINVHAAPFGAGNIVVWRVGNGVSVLTNGGNITFLDEYTTNGVLMQSILCPTNWTYPGGVTNWPICNRPAGGGTPETTSEGCLTRSVDGQYLFMAGYGTNGASLPLSQSIDLYRGTNSTGGVGLPRIVARCDWTGKFDTTTALTNWASGSGNFPRAAASTEGVTVWIAGQGQAVRTCDLGESTMAATSINGATSGGHPNPTNNVRDVEIYNYQLYASLGGSAANFTHVYGVYDTGLPTGGDKPSTNMPGVFTGAGPSPHQFVLLNVTNSVPGVNVLYVADDATGGGGGIYKFCLTNGVWGNFNQVSDPVNLIDTAGQRIDGLTGSTDGSGKVVLYFTSNSGGLGSYLWKMVDTNGVGAAGVGTITQLANLFNANNNSNGVWKGVAFAPVSNAAPPSARFAADPTTGPAPLFVTFYFTNTVGSITNVFWDFGDASNPNYLGDPTFTNRMVHNVTHYYAPGTYTVTNIVSGPLGSSARVAVNYIVVTNPPAPKADFTLWQSNSVAPSTVIFTNVSYGGYTNQFWDFGDGGHTNITPDPPPAISNSSFSVGYVYPYAGTYTVTLTVRSYSGISTTQRVNVVTVTGASPTTPVADFTVSTNNGVAPLTVGFFDNSTGYITNRFWNFGDGNTTNITVYTSGSIGHTYASSGIYTSQLTVTGIGSGTTNQLITVTGPASPFATWQTYYFPGGGANSLPGADPDGDGLSNTNEFLLGLNPTNSAARLRIISIAKTSGTNVTVTYLGASGDSTYSGGPLSRTNVLESTTGTPPSYTNNFVSTGLTNVLTGGMGLGTTATFVHTNGATGPARYYRVKVFAP